MVGITKFDPTWIYTEDRRGVPYEIPEDFQYAIVFAVEMDFDAVNTAPKMPSSIATYNMEVEEYRIYAGSLTLLLRCLQALQQGLVTQR